MKRLFTFIAALAFAATSHAAVFTVTNTADSGTGSLRDQIAAALTASGSNTIVFDLALSGQAILLNSEIIVTDSNNTGTDTLIIDASNLPSGIIIDGGAVLEDGSGYNRIFSIASGDRADFRRLTLTGGAVAYGIDGGAIYNDGNLTLYQCTLSGNIAREMGSGCKS